MEHGFFMEGLVSDSAVHRKRRRRRRRRRRGGRLPSYNELDAYPESHLVSDSDFRWQRQIEYLVMDLRWKHQVLGVLQLFVNCVLPRNLSGC
jgi:hypothetical protein